MKSPENAIRLTPAERTVILQHVPLPNGVIARLRFAVHSEAGVEVRMSDADFDTFTRAMLMVLAETDDMALADILTGVLSRIHPIEPDSIPEEFDRSMFPPDLPDAICQEIHTMLRTGEFPTLEDAYEAVQALLEGHNDEPLAVLGGLTPDQGFRLLTRGWNQPGSVLQIQDDMTAEELAGSAYYRHAVAMLRLVEAAGGAKLTPQKNLNRQWVQQILTQIVEPEFAFLMKDTRFQKLNEQGCPPVHHLRIFLEAAKLVRVQKGKLHVTKLGRQCLDPARAGELQRRLFVAMGTQFNLAYFDGAPDYPDVQETYPFILYALGKAASEPIDKDEACNAIYLPEVAAGFETYQDFSHASFVFHSRIARPLYDFGLLRWTPGIEELDPAQRRFQVTPLFARMIHFDF